MFIIIGIVVVFASIVVGFTIAGGNLVLLIQISEFITIGGAAAGSFLIATPLSVIKKIFALLPKALKGESFSKQDYLDLLKAFNDLFLIAQRDGLLSIESHVEDPKESEILSQSKKFVENKFISSFFCDTMKVMLSGGVPPHELENLMDSEIETYEAEFNPVPSSITKLADSFPGLGIVAAVLGIIVTMASIDKGAEVVGHHVAAALVGTFLGVLLSYGIFNPIGSILEHVIEHEVRFMQTIKTCIVAYAKGNPPIVAVEMARRTIFTDVRPTFSELEDYMRNKG